MKPAFHLDGLDYYYYEENKIYFAIDLLLQEMPTFVREKEVILFLERDASFSISSDFEFIKPILRPTVVRLLTMKQMIQIHQIMIS